MTLDKIMVTLPPELLTQLSTTTIDELPENSSGKTRWTEEQKTKNRKSRGVTLKKFIGWDGEGVTVPNSSIHNYVLFGNSAGYEIQSADERTNLSTRDCFTLMLKCEYDHPDAIHVGFSFKYDVEMMTKDISTEGMRRLYETTHVKWGPYQLQYIPGKWFQVSTEIYDPRTGTDRKVTCKIWDVFGFFQTSFVTALREYLPKNTPGLQQVVSGKSQRSSFSFDELETVIKPYWKIEVGLLVMLMNKLREHLHTAKIPINHWHGPGAIASKLYSTHNTGEAMCRDLPDSVSYKSQRAFAGGRFEAWRIGRTNQPIYVYDINSAYPAGMVSLPPLTGQWHRVDYPGQISNYGVYEIEYDRGVENGVSQTMNEPHPFFYRDKNSNVYFPPMIPHGAFVWQPEIMAATKTGHDFFMVDGWELEPTNEQPFSWVQEMYDKRREWKSAGIQAQWALKLGLNSLYGKTAQRVGWELRPDRIPKWHQLEWAGYITSSARAKLWAAIWQAWQKGGLVSCDTDSVTSLYPLDLPVSNQLGDWDCNIYDDLIYLQNGIYFTKINGEWTWKFRGLDNDSLTVDDAIEYCNRTDPYGASPEEMIITGRTTRFIGGKSALHENSPESWRTWETRPQQVRIGTSGKRIHHQALCDTCEGESSPLGTRTHHLICDMPTGILNEPSQAHFIPWNEESGIEWQDPHPTQTFDP